MTGKDKLTGKNRERVSQITAFWEDHCHGKAIPVKTAKNITQKSSRPSDIGVGKDVHKVKLFHDYVSARRRDVLSFVSTVDG